MNSINAYNYKDFCITNFDANYYLSLYDDIQINNIDPLTHYRDFGFYEGRKSFPEQSMPTLNSTEINQSTYISFPIQLFIPSFNNPTYLDNFVSQVREISWLNPIIYDNNSSTTKMLKLLDKIESSGIEVIRRKDNLGPESIYLNEGALKSLPDYFLLSDPDLDLRGILTVGNLKKLYYISEFYQLGKVGFALQCEKNKVTKKTLRHGSTKISTYDWERQFWKNIIGSIDGDPIYSAAVGATFCLVNKKFLDLSYHWTRGARIAGTLTIRHLPWEERRLVPLFELWRYRSLQKHSFYSLPTVKKRFTYLVKDVLKNRKEFS